MATNTGEGPGSRMIRRRPRPVARWITELDHVIAISDHMALTVHAGFQPKPMPKVIWFVCRVCKRDLPIVYLDRESKFGLSCSLTDCPGKPGEPPEPFPFRPLAKRAASRPHAGQPPGDSPVGDTLHDSPIRTALNQLTRPFRAS